MKQTNKLVLGICSIAIALGCAGQLFSQAQPATCKPAPEKFLNASKDICDKNESWACCGYGFLNAQNDMCFYLLCQPTDSCSSEWTYQTVTCPPPNPEIQPKNRGTSWDGANVPI